MMNAQSAVRGRVPCAVVAATALTLVACGGNEDATNRAASPTTASVQREANGHDGSRPAQTNGTGDWEAVVEAANEEGEVTWYTSSYDLDRAGIIEGAFEDEHPDIDLTIVRESPNPIMQKVEAELDSGNGIADIVTMSEPQWLADRVGAGLVPIGDLPNLSQYNDKWLYEDSYFVADVNAFGFAWNTQLVPDGIDGAEDFTSSELAGLVGVVEPTFPAAVSVNRDFEEHYGADLVNEIADNGVVVYDSALPTLEALAAGEIGATWFTSAAVIASIQDAGAPVEFFLPKDAYMAPGLAGIVESSPQPNAAKVLANWIMSPAADAARGPDMPALHPDSESIGYAGDYELADMSWVTPDAQEDYYEAWSNTFR